MSWPQWPQAQVAPSPAAAPLMSTTQSLGGLAHSSALPPPPMAYTTTQYASMTAEQQYAIQQWQNYHQQYAQWHAQYGEQYQREMQAKLGVSAPTIPYMSSVPPLLPQPPSALGGVPSMNIASSFNIPPPNIQMPTSQPPPPPPPPPENENNTSIIEKSTHTQMQPSSAKLVQNTEQLQSSKDNENVLAGFVRETKQVYDHNINPSISNKTEEDGKAGNWNRGGGTPWQQQQNKAFHQGGPNQQNKFQGDNRSYKDRRTDRKNFGGNNNRFDDRPYNKRKGCTENTFLDFQNQPENQYGQGSIMQQDCQENNIINPQPNQGFVDEDNDDKTPEEKAFDEQFQKWEEEFENWKKQNANHPDKRAYKEYEMKFEDCRKKLLERREIMKRRKLEKKFQGQKRLQQSQSKDTPQQPRQISNKITSHQDKNISNLQMNLSAKTSEYQPEKEISMPVNATAAENVSTRDKAISELNTEKFEMEESNQDLEKESIKDVEKDTTDSGALQKSEGCLDFLQGSKKQGGIPGLDLLPEEIGNNTVSENYPLDEEVTEVIDLEADSKPMEIVNEHENSNAKDFETGKKEIPSLFAQKIEKPDLSPPLPRKDDGDCNPFKRAKFEEKSFSNKEDNPIKRTDEINPLKRNENTLQPDNTTSVGPDGNVAMLNELASALSDPNVLALLNAALSNTSNTAPLNPQQMQPQNNISPWLPGQQPFGTRPLLDDQHRNKNIFENQTQNFQNEAGNMWQDNRHSLTTGNRFDNNNVPWASSGLEGSRKNYDNIFDRSFNEIHSENLNFENDRRSFKDTRNIFDRNTEADKRNKRRNFESNRNRNPWNTQVKDDDWGNNNKRGNNLNRGLDIANDSSQGSDRFSDRGGDNGRSSRDRDNVPIGRPFERGNKRNSRDRNKRSNLIDKRDRSRSFGRQTEDVNVSQHDSHRNPFLNEPHTSDDYFRPAHVIDYQNKPLMCSTAFSGNSGNNFRRNEILLPTKVVDYGHKPSNSNVSGGNRSGFSKNVENINKGSDEYFPMKTIDYGHTSAKSTESNNSSKNSNSNMNKNFNDNNSNNTKYNRSRRNTKNARKGNEIDNRMDQNPGNRRGDNMKDRLEQKNEIEESSLAMENNEEQDLSQFSESINTKSTEQNINDNLFTENIEDSDIDFTKDDFIEFSPKGQSPLRTLAQEIKLVEHEGNEDSMEHEEQLEEISEDDDDFDNGTTFKSSKETNALLSTSSDEHKGLFENDSKFQEFESESNNDELEPFTSSSLSVNRNKSGSFSNSSQYNENANSFYPNPASKNNISIANSSVPSPSSSPSFSSSNIFSDINNSSDTKIFPQETNIISKNTMLIDEILFKPGRDVRPKKIVIILRGPPGSGKSHIAKLIKEKEIEIGGSAPRLLSIDDYFMIENDKEEKCPKTGRKILTKQMIYEYEPEMEESYFQYLLKAYKKTVNDRLFDIIIIDCCNHKLQTLHEFYNIAKDAKFSPFVIDLLCDIETCLSRNIHNRKKHDIEKIIEQWSSTPEHYMKLDCTKLLQSAAIQEVEMEDVSDTEDDVQNEMKIINDEQIEEGGGVFLKSKWDTDPTEEKLARLDGTNKPLQKRATTLEDYLQIDGWEPSPSNSSNKKRVRWADIEEKREQDKMRAIGFVVGHTDWKRMMDPTGGSSALTKTKYIERVKKNK